MDGWARRPQESRQLSRGDRALLLPVAAETVAVECRLSQGTMGHHDNIVQHDAEFSWRAHIAAGMRTIHIASRLRARGA